jgi:hypothetical protein
LGQLVNDLEAAIRSRLEADLQSGHTPDEAIRLTVMAIPREAYNRGVTREHLTEIGEAAGLAAVLESLNWGDYELLFDKFYDRIAWFGPSIEKAVRLSGMKRCFVDAHVVRHNNHKKLRDLIQEEGFLAVFGRMSGVRDQLVG